MLLTSRAVVLATTAMAVSGTVVLLACRLQIRFMPPLSEIRQTPGGAGKTTPSSHFPRSCISSSDKKKERSQKKRVHFAKDVVEPSENNQEYRRLHCNFQKSTFASHISWSKSALKKSGKSQQIPPNRMAIYASALKERGLNQLTHSY
ncbi:unnamed protein product [Cuscuta campestris]|uniref:Uncharacterized protein n=1 Tax=Cuscuta campestris TaxID=132261 RepID=A0A484LB73_9ASTE|nr:unnamed protein product [Cuscuta campestris]